MSRGKWIAIGSAVVAVSAIGVGGLYFSAEGKRVEISEFMPLLPQGTDMLNTELRIRINDADARLKTGLFPSSALKELSRLYHVNGFYDLASDCYEALKILEPDEPHWPHLLSKIKASYGMLDQAIENGRKTVERAPDYLPAWLDLGNSLLKRNEPLEAERAFQAALERDPNEPHILLGMARARIAQKNWQDAEWFLEKSVRYAQGTVGVELLATVYRELGKDESADRLLFAHDIGTHVDPADPWLEELMIDSYDTYALSISSGMAARRGDRKAAQKWIDRAAELAPNDPIVLFQLAHTAVGAGDAQAAIRYYERCVRLKPDFSDGWHFLLKSYQDIGNQVAAKQTLVRGYENCPNSPAILIEMANSFYAQKKYQRAISFFRKSIRFRPNEALAYIGLARIYFVTGEVDKGIRSMEDALNAEPGYPLALTTLAKYAIETGNKSKAEEYLAKIRLQPKVNAEDAAKLAASFQETFR